MLSDDDAATLDMDRADYLTGPAGMTIRNCVPALSCPASRAPRPLLLNCLLPMRSPIRHPDPSRMRRN